MYMYVCCAPFFHNFFMQWCSVSRKKRHFNKIFLHPFIFQVNMTVDNTFTEKWMTTGAFNMLASSKVFIGGSEAPYKLPGTNSRNNFVGCLKKVNKPSSKA